MNAMGPGEATFVKCDVSKEEEIKVSSCLLSLCLIDSFYVHFLFSFILTKCSHAKSDLFVMNNKNILHVKF